MRADAPDPGRLLIDAKELARLLSVSPATVERMKAAGKLPPPIPLSAGCVRWRLATIEAWLAEAERLGRLPDAAEWALQHAQTNGRP